MLVLIRGILVSLRNVRTGTRNLFPESSAKRRPLCSTAGHVQCTPGSGGMPRDKRTTEMRQLLGLKCYENERTRLLKKSAVPKRRGRVWNGTSESPPDEGAVDGIACAVELGDEFDHSGRDSASEDLKVVFTCSDPKYCKRRKTKEDVKRMAIGLLAARAFTASDLRKRLISRKCPVDVTESVMADLQSRGLLNDGLYAESFSRSRWLSYNWGPRRIKKVLLEKGVSEEIANTAISLVFENENPADSSQMKCLGMSKLSLDRLFAQVSKQWLQGQGKALDSRKSSIIRWLQYRGFEWAVIKSILKMLESEYPP